MISPDDPAPSVGAVSTIAPDAGSGARAWTLALAAGLLAGLIAWGVGEKTLVPEAGYGNKKEHVNLLPSVAGTRNGIVSFGVLGAATGLALGLAGGLIRRSAVRAILVGMAGLIVGGGAAVALSRLVLPIYYEHSRGGDLTYSLMVHGGVWVAVGAVAGLVFGIGLGGWRRMLQGLLGGAGAALLATVVYEFGGGVLYPQAFTDRPISMTWETRLAARLLVTVMAAAGVVLATRSAESGKDLNVAKS